MYDADMYKILFCLLFYKHKAKVYQIYNQKSCLYFCLYFLNFYNFCVVLKTENIVESEKKSHSLNNYDVFFIYQIK